MGWGLHRQPYSTRREIIENSFYRVHDQNIDVAIDWHVCIGISCWLFRWEKAKDSWLNALIRPHQFRIHCPLPMRRSILDHMEFYLTREDYERAKPHPDTYLKGLQRFGATAVETVVI